MCNTSAIVTRIIKGNLTWLYWHSSLSSSSSSSSSFIC